MFQEVRLKNIQIFFLFQNKTDKKYRKEKNHKESLQRHRVQNSELLRDILHNADDSNSNNTKEPEVGYNILIF